MATETRIPSSLGVMMPVDPTVVIKVQVFTAVEGSPHLAWADFVNVEPVRALVRSESELAAVVANHGPQVAVQVEATSYPLFRLVVHCLTTGFAVAQWMWERNQGLNRFLPAETPWFTWDDRLRLEKLAANMRAQLSSEEAEVAAQAG